MVMTVKCLHYNNSDTRVQLRFNRKNLFHVCTYALLTEGDDNKLFYHKRNEIKQSLKNFNKLDEIGNVTVDQGHKPLSLTCITVTINRIFRQSNMLENCLNMHLICNSH